MDWRQLQAGQTGPVQCAGYSDTLDYSTIYTDYLLVFLCLKLTIPCKNYLFFAEEEEEEEETKPEADQEVMMKYTFLLSKIFLHIFEGILSTMNNKIHFSYLYYAILFQISRFSYI